MHILVPTAGPSSQKAALYGLGDALPDEPPAPDWEAHAEWSERSAVKLRVTTAAGARMEREYAADSRRALVAELLPALWSGRR